MTTATAVETCRICEREHRQGIGGTDMAAILGLTPYRNALDVFHNHTRPDQYLDEEEESIDLLRGRELERKIASWYYNETGDRGRAWPGGFVTHPDYPAFVCHPDQELFSNESHGPGVLEIKAPRASVFSRVYERGLRQSEVVQLQLYAAVTRRPYVAFAYGNLEHSAGPVLPIQAEADEGLGQFLLDVGQRFWDECVVPRIPPDPDEWKLIADPDAPDFTPTEGERVDVDDADGAERARLLLDAQRVKKDAEDLVKMRKQALDEWFEEHPENDRVRFPGVARVTLVKNQGRVTFSRDALEGHRPIDRDKLYHWLKTGVALVDPEDHEEILASLELDLSEFERQGGGYKYVLANPDTE